MYQTSRSKGQELVAQRMVRYFNRLGHQAHLITSIYHDGTEVLSEAAIDDKGYVEVEDSELGIPIIRVASFISNWPPRRIVFKDPVHILERIVNDFQLNVLITHSTLWNGPEEAAKFVEWRRNIKALGGYQDLLVFCHMSHFQEPSARRYSLVERSFRMAWNRLSLRTILRVANLILVVTPYEEEAKTKMGALREKCFLFPGGADDNAFASFASANPEELLQRFGMPRNAKIVAYVGTIEERKNPMAVLEVAERLRSKDGIHFVIAGRGDSAYSREVKQRAYELPNVTYLGELGERERTQLIRLSYLNILLSRMEALGIAQLEFMFQGVPVITSGVGGQSWIVRNGQEGIHVRGPGDIEGAARAVVELVDDSSKRQRYSDKARERASDFAFTKLIKKLDQAITNEIESESGLAKLPSEVRCTLSEPEMVGRTWSHGAKKLAATNKRLFIQRGLLSRSTLEIPYSSINSIEHIRRYPWATLIIGGGLSSAMFIQHYVSPIISRTLTSELILFLTSMLPGTKVELSQLLAHLWLVPISIALILFLIGARKGYALHGARLSPIYLPQSFSEAVQYIRESQDQHQSGSYASGGIAEQNAE
ncbi:glycosyltransferase [[Eubacterium] cellulosolvens]